MRRRIEIVHVYGRHEVDNPLLGFNYKYCDSVYERYVRVCKKHASTEHRRSVNIISPQCPYSQPSEQ